MSKNKIKPETPGFFFILEPDPKPPDDLRQFLNRTQNRQITWFSSRTGSRAARLPQLEPPDELSQF